MKLEELLLTGVLMGAGIAQAEIIARFDVGASGTNAADQEGFVQEGWADVNLSNAASGVTQNGVTLTIGAGADESRNRSGPVIAEEPLELVFRDFLFTRLDDGEVPITFSGLRPNTDYEIISYAYDSSGGNNETGSWYLGSVSPENLQHTWTSTIATLDDPGDIFRLTGTSNAEGELVFIIVVEVANMRINGFEVDELGVAVGPPVLDGLIYDATTGEGSVTIAGAPGDRMKLIRSNRLDFGTPDEDPVTLTGASVGTLDGDTEVLLDDEGTATVTFNFGTEETTSFLRAERLP